MALTKGAKIGGSVAVAAVAYFALSHYNLVPGARVKEAEVPKKVELPTEAPSASTPDQTVTQAALPTSRLASSHGPVITMNVWAWNAQMGLFLANGGPTTTSGSLMDKRGVTLKFYRQDDTEKSKPMQLKFAQLLAKGNSNPVEADEKGTPTTTHFVVIMGDGSAQYLAAMNKELERIGPDYRAEIVGAVGYSRGEDAFEGPQEWKDNPEAMKGGLVAGVLRDGDWNIAQYYLAQNGVKNNPDEKTWDPDALNWVAADDYLKAAEMYITGYCEDRLVVRNGKKTGEKVNKCVQGVVTWTPGDVNIAKKKGGLVKILSTKENVYQMPAVVIGIHKWDVDHSKQVQEMLAAAFEGADQVKNFDAALSRAGQASYSVYAEESAGYWVKYYKGVTERDKAGMPVPLGGSTVMNLADNMVLFGLAEGSGGLSNSLFHATYEGFGNIAKQQYPSLVPSFPPTQQAVNTSFVQALATRMNVNNADVQKFEEAGPIAKENIVAKRNWNIQFDTGKDTFTPAAEATLNELYNQLVVGGALSVEIDGHTDNVGNPQANQDLSERRAFAVKKWLEVKAPTLFPENRLSVKAFGQTSPLVPNDTPENRAKNRRVTVILGTK